MHRILLVITLWVVLLAGAPAAPANSAVLAPEVITLNEPTLTPPYGPLCTTFWYKIPANLYGFPFYLTLSVDTQAHSFNSGDWRPNLPSAGVYKVEAFIPDHSPIDWTCNNRNYPIAGDSLTARYTIQHAFGSQSVVINQAAVRNDWVSLGQYSFNAGSNGFVHLSDLTTDADLTRTVSFSAMRFTFISPTPTAHYLPLVDNDFDLTLKLVAAFVTDTSNTVRSAYLPGEMLRYYISLQNNTGVVGPAHLRYSQTGPCGSSLIFDGLANLSLGQTNLYQSALAPSCIGVYTYTLQATYLNFTSTLSSPLLINGASAAVPGQYQALDTCPLVSWMTVPQMQAWWDYSPYSAMNLYIGGPALYEGCQLQGMNATWISDVSQQGWTFIPTWAGLQAPCRGGPGPKFISTDPAIATQQGSAQADLAFNAGRNLGFLEGMIIYTDIEAFTPPPSNPDSCNNPVKAYINGWTARLHYLGIKAGVYGLSSNLSIMWGLTYQPDDVWIASWNSTRYYDASASPYYTSSGSPILPGLWNQKRIRQYTGDYYETWAGITIEIDHDVLDGEVTMLPKLGARGQSIPTGKITNFAPSRLISDIQPVAAGQGWVLREGRLFWTTDSGSSWQDITPSLPADAQGSVADVVLTANLKSAENGWLVMQSAADNKLYEIKLTPGGSQAYPLPSIDLPISQAWTGFSDDQNGWVSLKIASNSAFSSGLLLTTSDGGLTWTQHDLPAAGPVLFNNSLQGWLAGAPGQTRLYATSDGGLSWQDQTAIFQHNPQETLFFDLPVLSKAQNWLLAVSTASVASAQLDLWSSPDSGHTWQLQNSEPLAVSAAVSNPLQVAIASKQDWLAATNQGRLLKSGQSPNQAPVSTLPDGVIALRTGGSGVYWALVSSGTCTGSKSTPAVFSCKQETRLYQSVDQGATWNEMSAPD